ncbi:TPA: glycosyltransferase, partial [Escherichia coli]|nr:glycosyltransferase [Escherichia coli]
MNIAILVPTLSVGGAEKIAIETARVLANQNNVVYLFVISKKNTFFPVEDKVHVVYLNGFNKIFQFYKLLKLYKIEKCISYLERANLLGLISCSLAKVDLCATVHTAPKSAFRNRPLINRIFIYITYKLISIMKHKVICVSQGIKDDLYDLYGIENSIVIPNFVNLSDVPKRNNSGEVLYDYIFVGRIEPVKGCDILVEAFLSISDWV